MRQHYKTILLRDMENVRIGDWSVFPAEGQLRRNGEERRLRPKAMAVLCVLAQAKGSLVSRDELLDTVWGPRAVSDEPLTATISELRRILDNPGDESSLIETLPKRGYRLLAEVRLLTEDGVESPPDGSSNNSATSVAPQGRRVQISIIMILLGISAVVAFYATSESASVMETPSSIAVMPFAPLDTDDDLDYFGESLAQELLTSLTRVENLKVAAWRSTVAVADQRSDHAYLRDKLNVDSVLDGSVQITQGRLRVRVQLVDLRNGYNLWAKSYDRNLNEGLLLQSEIAKTVAGLLQAETPGLVSSSLIGQKTAGTSYAKYLHGRYLYENARSKPDLLRAQSLLEDVISANPQLAPAFAALAGVHIRLADLGYLPSAPEGYERARQLSKQALSLDNDLAEGHLLLGWIALYGDWSWSNAKRQLTRALNLAPGDRTTLSSNAALQFHLGALEQAARLASLAADRDPLSASAQYNLAYFLFVAGVYQESRIALARATQLEPAFPGSGLLKVQLDLAAGDIERAKQHRESHALLALVAETLIADAAGDGASADRTLKKLEVEHEDQGAYQIATLHATLGNKEEAFMWLERAMVARDPGIAELLVDPLLSSLREDPRYLSLLERIDLNQRHEFPASDVL